MISRQKRTEFWITSAGVFVQSGLIVTIRDTRPEQSPALAQNSSNATTVLSVNSSTVGEFGDAVLSELSVTSSLASNTPTGIGDPTLLLPFPAPTIQTS